MVVIVDAGSEKNNRDGIGRRKVGEGGLFSGLMWGRVLVAPVGQSG